MASVLIGVIWEIGDGFIRLGAGGQIRVPPDVWRPGLVVGIRVTVRARLLGAEWVADEIVPDEPPQSVEARRPPSGMDHETLRSVIRAKISDGRLSRDALPVVSGKAGNELPCSACDQPVPKPQVMIEGSRPGGPPMRFHVECFSIWEDERRRA